MRMMIRKHSFHSRGNGIEIGVSCLLKIDIGKKLFHLRSKRYLAQNYVLSKSFFARFALQPLIANDFYGFEFGFSEPEKEQNEQGVSDLDVSVSLTVVDEPNFFVLGERLPAFGLIGSKAIPNMAIVYVRKICTSRFAACVRDGEGE